MLVVCSSDFFESILIYKKKLQIQWGTNFVPLHWYPGSIRVTLFGGQVFQYIVGCFYKLVKQKYSFLVCLYVFMLRMSGFV